MGRRFFVFTTFFKESIESLNALCGAIAPFSAEKRAKLSAAILMAKPDCASQIRKLAENIDQFDFIPDATTPADYGKYMIRHSGNFLYDDVLDEFYDFEKCGRRQAEQEHGEFSEYGYLSYHGTLPLEELMRENSAEQSQGGMYQQMV